jgi:hypothetical protein
LKAKNQKKKTNPPINKIVFNERSKLVRLERASLATPARIAAYSTIPASSFMGTPFGKNE